MRLKFSLRQKTVCATLLFAFILTAVAVFASYRVYSDTMDNHYRTLTMHVAKTAAAMVNAEQVSHYTQEVTDIYLQNPAPDFSDEGARKAYFAQYEGIIDNGYTELFETLEKIKAANDVQSLYIVYMDPATMTCVYVVDGDNTANACPIGTWDIIYPQNQAALKTPENGFPAYITNTKEYGWLCSAGAAIIDSNGKTVAHAMVDISMDRVMQDRHDYLCRIGLILLAVTIILIVLFIGVVNGAVVRPVNQLADAAASYVSDKARTISGQSSIEQLHIHTGDEIENLCGAIKQMEQDINRYIENLTVVTAEKERIGAELDVATHIQASMLPCIFPAFPERSEFDIYASMQPAKEVGGDFYDFFLVDDDHLAVVIADVSGKGVPAALFMVIAKTLIKDHTQAGTDPAEVFSKVNQQLCESNDEGMFVTAWMGVLEISSGYLVFVNAGHNPPLIHRGNDNWEYLKQRSGFVLAGMEDMHYKSGILQLNPGDALYLYTDGVTEATDSAEMLYGETRLKEKLNQAPYAASEQLLAVIQQDVEQFVGQAPQFDDITMLALKLNGGSAQDEGNDSNSNN